MREVSIIILTYNEEVHIKRCIDKAKLLTDKIFIVDSFSKDKTVEIAKENGAQIVQNKWPGNQAEQFNWALDNLDIDSEWILRLDADEYLKQPLIEEIKEKLPKLSKNINGVFLDRRLVFMSKLIKYGGDQTSILRIFRKGKARYDQSWMDEHLALSEGESITFDHFFVDDNLDSLGRWTDKHNDYSIREVINILDIQYQILKSSKDQDQNFKKKSLYLKLPLFFRAFAYFFFKYFIKLGFLDGKVGFIRHFLQGWWYRTLVDAKLYEINKTCGSDLVKIKTFLKERYHIEL